MPVPISRRREHAAGEQRRQRQHADRLGRHPVPRLRGPREIDSRDDDGGQPLCAAHRPELRQFGADNRVRVTPRPPSGRSTTMFPTSTSTHQMSVGTNITCA